MTSTITEIFIFTLMFLTACTAQQHIFHVRSDKCTQNCSCSDPCLTLSEYVCNSSQYFRSSSKFIFTVGTYSIDNDVIIESVSDFSIVGSGNTPIVIDCQQKAVLQFKNVSGLTIQNLRFAFCGHGSLSTLQLINVAATKLIDLTVAKSITGTLTINDSTDLEIINLSITNNHNYNNSILSLVQSSDVLLLGTTTITNNSITSSYGCGKGNSLISIAESTNIYIESLMVTDNSGPHGIVNMSQVTLQVNGTWAFVDNTICKGGSLSFVQSNNIYITGHLIFQRNQAQNRSIAGLLTISSGVHIDGGICFESNRGNISGLHSIDSIIVIVGLLTMSNEKGGRGIRLISASILEISGLVLVENNHLNPILINDSTMNFNGNMSFIGNSNSPIVSFSGNMQLIGSILFENNPGVIFGILSEVYINGTSNFTANDIRDEFIDGTLAIERSSLTLDGDYMFKDNDIPNKYGGAIYVSNECLLTLGGNGRFVENKAYLGGGIYFDQNSRLVILDNTSLLFDRNLAVKGGALFIQGSVSIVNCVSLRCFFQEENRYARNVSLVFHGNQAYPGASILHANIDYVDPDLYESFPALDNFVSTFMESSSNSLPSIASDSYRLCFCSDSQQNCDDSPKLMTAFKGKPFSLNVTLLKFFGDRMPEPVRGNLNSSLRSVDTDTTVRASVTGSGKLQRVSAQECSEIVFTIESSASEEVLFINVGESLLDQEKTLQVTVMLKNTCPRGFNFNDRNSSCVCNHRLEKYLENCEIMDTQFQKTSEYQDYWFSYSIHSNALIFYDSCPSEYCVVDDSFTFENDSICSNNRVGLLCGTCAEGFSVLIGGKKCSQCSNNYIALIIVFALLGILLIAFLFATQMTVAAGTINGLIFYANIVNANRNVFFSENFFHGYTVIISWLNLDFGIEACFYHGMNQETYSGLSFLFPLYLWLLAIVVIIICRFSPRASKFLGTRDPVAVLATLVLLSYNSLIEQVIAIFSIAQLENSDNTTRAVWLYNGNVDYATDGHGVLIVVALVFLILLFLPYMLALISAQFLLKSVHISKILQRLRLQPFIHTYLVPLKPAHRYWVGLSLLVRAILLIIFAVAEREAINLIAVTTVCFIAISMFKVSGGIYDKDWLDNLEISFLVNLGIFSAATSYELSSNDRRDIAAYLSLTVALFTFITITAFHIFWQLKKVPKFNLMIKNLQNKYKVMRTSQHSVSNQRIRSGTIEIYKPRLRESLLEC